MSLMVGAYAAEPHAEQAGPGGGTAFVAQLGQLPGVRGLELPFDGSAPTDDPAFRAALDPGWDFVLTCFPGTMLEMGAQPGFGLASPDPAGRQAALDFAGRLLDSVRRLNDWLGRAAVIAVEVHAAPSRVASASVFTDSLAELASWDWEGAVLTVEHCDAFRPGQEPQKGFLSLEHEIEAVRAAAGQTRVGITLNWARSAIEGRSAAVALDHVECAEAAGVLSGLMFSGCADHDTEFGAAWLDAHVPPSARGLPAMGDLPALAGPSLLTPPHIRRCLEAAGPGLDFTGLKIALRPLTLDVPTRVEHLRQAIELIERSRSGS